MNRHSIFFKLNLLFSLALLMLALLFLFFIFNTKMHERHLEGERGMELMRLMHHTQHLTPAQRSAELQQAQFELLETQQLPETARPLALPGKEPRIRRPFVLYSDAGSYYFQSRNSSNPFLVREKREVETFSGLYLIFLLLLFGLSTLYLTIRRSLKPLKTLTQRIRRFAHGDHSLDIPSQRQDEIAIIANEFNDAVKTISGLQSSRQLFLRNIMHELKTPLTKGKLTLAMMENSEQTTYLDTLLNRMDTLINQFAHIEKLQSTQLHKEERNVYALLQEAIRNLYLETSQNHLLQIHAETEVMVSVDSELFTSALSNLLDNALKYRTSGSVIITIERDRLCISNHAEAMPEPIESYLKPFTSEHHRDGGLGLGLYIVDSIVTTHGFILDYRHEKDIHTFCIRFS